MSVCISGGCDGADIIWGDEALKAGHELIHYGFSGMKSQRQHQVLWLNYAQLIEADKHLIKANETLHRAFPTKSEYVNNLLRRNFWQVKHSNSVYAVAPIKGGVVQGGTGWAVQMAIDGKINIIYCFDLETERWMVWNYKEWIPEGQYFTKPSGTYAGVGSREITDAGRKAIQGVYSSV
jgi:hypothetical protein